jgi:hypothetical protein
MKIVKTGANTTVIELNNGVEILVSYSTPVAAFVPGEGYLRTEEKYSKTTTRHINQWTGGERPTRPQEFFDKLFQRD